MNHLSRRTHAAARKLQRGFTLIELAIVGLFLGLLAIFAISQFTAAATDTTRANGLIEASRKVADSWALISQSCGVSTDISATNISDGSGATAVLIARENLSVLLGTRPVRTTHERCFATSGVRPLSGVSQGAAGAEAIQGHVVTVSNLTVSGRNALAMTLAGVPDSVTLPLYNRLSSVAGAATATAVPATADTTDNGVRFSAPVGGTRTVTLIRVL